MTSMVKRAVNDEGSGLRLITFFCRMCSYSWMTNFTILLFNRNLFSWNTKFWTPQSREITPEIEDFTPKQPACCDLSRGRFLDNAWCKHGTEMTGTRCRRLDGCWHLNCKDEKLGRCKLSKLLSFLKNFWTSSQKWWVGNKRPEAAQLVPMSVEMQLWPSQVFRSPPLPHTMWMFFFFSGPANRIETSGPGEKLDGNLTVLLDNNPWFLDYVRVKWFRLWTHWQFQ